MTDSLDDVPGGDGSETPDAEALVSRLRVIDDQPLETRATGYVRLHDELRTRLEGGDVPIGRGTD